MLAAVERAAGRALPHSGSVQGREQKLGGWSSALLTMSCMLLLMTSNFFRNSPYMSVHRRYIQAELLRDELLDMQCILSDVVTCFQILWVPQHLWFS